MHRSKNSNLENEVTMFQMKQQDKAPKEELSEMEIGNLPDKEFKVMIVKMIKELRRKMDGTE